MLIDYNNEIDKYRAHTKDSMDEFKQRPIKNFDFTPTSDELLSKIIDQHKAETLEKQSNDIQRRQSALASSSLHDHMSKGGEKYTTNVKDFFLQKIQVEIIKKTTKQPTVSLNKDQEEIKKRHKFEKKFKKSDQYIESIIK